MSMACPHCGAPVVEKCRYCQKCSRMAVAFQFCPKCKEPFSDQATRCPHCTHELPTERAREIESLELEIRATHWGAFFCGGSVTGLFLPPIIRLSQGRIRVTKWTLFGLREHKQDIQMTRVASVRYTKGVFWGGLLIETFGGAAEDLTERGLVQEQARTMATQLERCLHDGNS